MNKISMVLMMINTALNTRSKNGENAIQKVVIMQQHLLASNNNFKKGRHCARNKCEATFKIYF